MITYFKISCVYFASISLLISHYVLSNGEIISKQHRGFFTNNEKYVEIPSEKQNSKTLGLVIDVNSKIGPNGSSNFGKLQKFEEKDVFKNSTNSLPCSLSNYSCGMFFNNKAGMYLYMN